MFANALALKKRENMYVIAMTYMFSLVKGRRR